MMPDNLLLYLKHISEGDAGGTESAGINPQLENLINNASTGPDGAKKCMSFLNKKFGIKDVSSFCNFIKNLFTNVTGSAKNFLNKIWSGIQSAMAWALKIVKKLNFVKAREDQSIIGSMLYSGMDMILSALGFIAAAILAVIKTVFNAFVTPENDDDYDKITKYFKSDIDQQDFFRKYPSLCFDFLQGTLSYSDFKSRVSNLDRETKISNFMKSMSNNDLLHLKHAGDIDIGENIDFSIMKCKAMFSDLSQLTESYQLSEGPAIMQFINSYIEKMRPTALKMLKRIKTIVKKNIVIKTIVYVIILCCAVICSVLGFRLKEKKFDLNGSEISTNYVGSIFDF